MAVNFNQVEEAYRVIRDGGLALLKADIGYGLFGHSDESIHKMYELKGRPLSNPCITIGSPDVLNDVAVLKDPRLMDWIEEVMQHTTVAVINEINPESQMLAGLPEYVRTQSTKDGTIATFLSTGEFMDELVKRAFQNRFLIVGSSGNVSSFGNNYRFEDVQPQILSGVDFYLDLGEAKYRNEKKLATTIVNLTNFTFKRQGVNHGLVESTLERFKQEVLGI